MSVARGPRWSGLSVDLKNLTVVITQTKEIPGFKLRAVRNGVSLPVGRSVSHHKPNDCVSVVMPFRVCGHVLGDCS